ncbi:3-oxoacyl-[acyl-carrier-protein] synthase, KASIII [Minicystis rosea]|nr:3-oxoacyl-[acyl-carrier-protein] synthase, KASIII [Minicystis rosea]
MQSIGILGLGTYLPPTVHTNDEWPASVVARWHERMAHQATRGDATAHEVMSDGARKTLAAMQEIAGDPFRGAIERRWMDEGTTVADMEAAAAREAMTRASVSPDRIDVILTQTSVPDHLFVNGASKTHHLLDLPRRCLAVATDVAANGLGTHAALAQALIASGRARHVLSVHSSAMSRVIRKEEPDSVLWGDGAAAVVFGPVGAGKGLLGADHNTDGENHEALVLGVPGRCWWDDGAITVCSTDAARVRAMLLTLVDRARDSISGSLADAGITAGEVDFYASHQGAAWLPRVSAEHAGLGAAKTLATFPRFGNMNSVNVPFVLATAEREGRIRDGSLVVTFGGGLGEAWSSLCLRWGR